MCLFQRFLHRDPSCLLWLRKKKTWVCTSLKMISTVSKFNKFNSWLREMLRWLRACSSLLCAVTAWIWICCQFQFHAWLPFNRQACLECKPCCMLKVPCSPNCFEYWAHKAGSRHSPEGPLAWVPRRPLN